MVQNNDSFVKSRVVKYASQELETEFFPPDVAQRLANTEDEREGPLSIGEHENFDSLYYAMLYVHFKSKKIDSEFL